MSGTRDEGRSTEGREAFGRPATPGRCVGDAGAIEDLGRQPGPEGDRPGPGEQPQDPPEELEEERRG